MTYLELIKNIEDTLKNNKISLQEADSLAIQLEILRAVVSRKKS